MPWNIGSATKAFVAVVVLQLTEEGRIDLDAGIDGYLPDLAAADRITPRQLLNHTSGISEYLYQPTVVNNPLRQWTPAELIAVAEAAGRMGEPGGPHHYSNTNYIVLGEIIEQLTGNPWADEVQARITEPLDMTHTSLITDSATPGYQIIDGSMVDVTHSFDPSVGGAAGAIQSTSRDLLAFATALADGTLVSAMQTFVPAEDLSRFGIDHGYGLGLERYAMDGITVIGHMGTGMIGSSYLGYDAKRGTAIAVSTNTAMDRRRSWPSKPLPPSTRPDDPERRCPADADRSATVVARTGGRRCASRVLQRPRDQTTPEPSTAVDQRSNRTAIFPACAIVLR